MRPPTRFLEPPDAEQLKDVVVTAAHAQSGERFGPWRAVELVAVGGMGAVYRARRDDGAYQQEVAIKLGHLGCPTPELRERFHREREIQARLQHPEIARLLDGGTTDDGQPWLAMEWIDGVPLSEFCNRHQLTVRERIELLIRICRAVEFAHQSLVIHQDLKPANLLVRPDRSPVVIDFGISQWQDTAPASRERALTPGYASPEQRAGSPLTTASDVYSLAVVIAELTTDARGRIRQDVDAILAAALVDDPGARLARAGLLADELERSLRCEPLQSRTGTLYRLRCSLNRHRWAATAAVAVTVGLAALTAFAFHGWRAADDARRSATAAEKRATREALTAKEEASRALAMRDFLRETLAGADPWSAGGREVTARDLLDRAGAALRASLDHDVVAQVYLHETLGVAYHSLGRADEAESHLRRALELGEEELDIPLADVANLRSSLGVVLYSLHRLDEAAELLELALEDQFDEPPARVHAANRLADLGTVRKAQGELAESEDLLREALLELDAIEAEFSDCEGLRPARATTRQNLADTLGALGRYEEAQEQLEAALAATDPADGSLYATILNNLATVRSQLGDRSGALEAWQDSYQRMRTALGDAHPNTAYLANNLASLHRNQGNLTRADELSRRAVDAMRESVGTTHPATGRVLRNHAGLCLALERRPEALELLREACSILGATLGAEDAETRRARSEFEALQKTLQG